MNIFNILREKKDHLISKLNLNDDQKTEIIEFFNRRPDLESKVDWNNIKALSYEFFKTFIKEADNQVTRGNIKKRGIGTFIEGKDYVDISINSDVDAFIPLTYKFQKFIQNTTYGNAEASWCIGFQKDDSYWESYTKDHDFIIFINKNKTSKIALQVPHNNSSIYAWNLEDNEIEIISQNQIFNQQNYKSLSDEQKSQTIYEDWEEDTGEAAFMDSIFKDIPTYLKKLTDYFNRERYVCFKAIKQLQGDTLSFLQSTTGYLYGGFIQIENSTIKEGQYIQVNLGVKNESIKHLVFEDVTLENTGFLIEASREQLAHKMPNLETIEFRTPNIQFSGSSMYFRFLKKLVSLKFHPNTPSNFLEEYISFEGCKALQTVELPLGLKKINRRMFSDCTSLKEFKVPENVEIIESKAFEGCLALVNVEFNSKLTDLSSEAFLNCIKLQSITNTQNIKSIGSQAFMNCSSLKSLDVSNVEFIEYATFKNCNKLKKINLKNIKLLQEAAFSNCKELQKVYLGKSLNRLRDRVFEGCIKLETLVFENKNLQEIGEHCFFHCSSLKEFDLDSVIFIKEFAFYSCTNLEKVRIGENKMIGDNAFDSCASLKKVIMKTKTDLSNIEDTYVFYQCPSYIDLSELTNF